MRLARRAMVVLGAARRCRPPVDAARWWLAVLLLAPHTAGAGAWTLPAGDGWAKISWFAQQTHEWYTATAEPFLRPDNTLGRRPAGSRRPYRFDGRYRSQAWLAEIVVGVTDRLDLGLQLPWFDQAYDDATRFEPPRDAGLGDLRAHAKWRLAATPVVIAVGAGVKAPTGDFRNEDGLIPVGEGQWDGELSLWVSRSLWPVPLWVHADVGYRTRARNDAVDLDPGDEWLFHGELGWRPHRRGWMALKIASMRGRPGSAFGIETASLTRRITYLAPTLSVELGGGLTAEAAARFSVGGRNYPAGTQWVLGLSSGFAVPGTGGGRADLSRRRRPRAAPGRA